MIIRQVARTIAVSVAALACVGGITTGFLAGPAGASTLTSSDGSTSLSTQGTVAAGTPYTSGQVINIDLAANSTIVRQI